MTIDKQTLSRGFLLAGWLVKPLEGQIRSSDGKRRHVTPKAMDVLVLLASRLGETVTRQTILENVWASKSASDEALTHCISELRHAFDDHADRPEYFQTIRKRGYRLIADVKLPDQVKAENRDGIIANQIRDLRKRKVFQALLGYPVLAWLLLQIVDTLWEYLLAPLGAPAWLVPTLVVLLAVGYPVAVFFAWAVDLTPEGVQITDPGEGAKPIAGLIGVGAITVFVTASALFLYFNAYETPQVVSNSEEQFAPPAVRFDKSIAVLRFDNMSATPNTDYIGDGLTEELIHELANLKTIKVAARASVWPLLASELSFEDIARRLKVEKILEGSVRVDGDQLRVTAQLIGEDGFHLWSQTYDRKLEGVLDIQKDIAVQVVDELDVLLASDAKSRLEKQPTTISAAYDQYLQGRHYLRLPASQESLDSAQSFFDQSIEIDNRFPLGYAGLCDTQLARYRLTRDTDHFSAAEMACHRALTLDGGLAEVYTALGSLYRHSGQYVKAEQEFIVALNINPTLENANFGLGRAYQGQGRLALAEKTLLRSIELEPAYWGAYMGIGNFLYRQGRYEESVPHYETVTQLAPEYAGGFINLGSSLHWLGDWDAANLAWQRALELSDDAMSYQNLGTLRFYQHEFQGAVEMYRRAVELSPEDHRNWGKLAAAQRLVSESEDKARPSYEKAIALVEARLEVNPNEAEDWYQLSTYRLRVGDLEQSRQAVDRSLELAPEDPSAHYFAALLELNTGNHEEAIDQLEKSIGFGYSSTLVAADPDLELLYDKERFKALINKNN